MPWLDRQGAQSVLKRSARARTEFSRTRRPASPAEPCPGWPETAPPRSPEGTAPAHLEEPGPRSPEGTAPAHPCRAPSPHMRSPGPPPRRASARLIRSARARAWARPAQAERAPAWGSTGTVARW